MFELHPVLKKDSFLITDLELCQLRLMDNAFYPWLILVPKKSELVEVIDLKKDEQILLMEEIDLVSKISRAVFKPDKLNIAALGNMVRQLHIHIISRYKTDRVFPKPVWVDNENKLYDEKQKDEVIAKIKKEIMWLPSNNL